MAVTDSTQPTPSPKKGLHRAGGYAKDTLSGLKSFLVRGNVVDLAIGIIIGASFTAVVNALVSDVITPLIPVPGNSLAGLVWHPPYAQKGVEVNLGALINAILSFLILAIILYFFIVRPMAALLARYNPPPQAAPATRECLYCLQSIPLLATRCAFCTSPLPPVDPNAPTPAPSSQPTS